MQCLTSIFISQVAKAPVAGPSKKDSTKKRKLDAEKPESPVISSKRSKPETVEQAVSKPSAGSKKVKVNPVKTKASSKGKGKEVDSDEDDEDDDRLESAYLDGKKSAVPKESGDEEDGGSDNEEDPDNLVHESLTKKNKKVRTPKTKYVPSEETSELRDQRTIFVGNLPIDLASKKVCLKRLDFLFCSLSNAVPYFQPLQKQLKHHILSSLPTAKIESIRFRSIPFQAPTAKLEDEDDDSNTQKKPAEPAKKELRAHEKERASTWRSKLDDKDEESVSKDEKRYLNPAQKKKIAFINQEFHSSAGTVNAYVVFAHPPNTEGRPANLPPPPPTMDPYQAALSAAEKCDGTIFMERMLRVDLVSKNKPTTSTTGSDETVAKPSILETDPRLSVFVGNLDFAGKEEDLRVFFESLMTTEKGAAPSKTDEESLNKPSTWVTRVRIVRDKDTQLGKGFAYVQFAVRANFILSMYIVLIALCRTANALMSFLLWNKKNLNSLNANCGYSDARLRLGLSR